jgi:hypothetical protein
VLEPDATLWRGEHAEYLATTELNLIKWYVATAFAMTGLACAITFGLTRLFAT